MQGSKDHQLLAEASRCYHANEIDTAEKLCAQVLRRQRRSIQAHELAGLIALKKRDWSQARRHYRQCQEQQPKNPRFPYLIAKVDTSARAYDQALRGFDKALRLDPRYQPALSWKAVVLERQGQFEEARAIVEPFVQRGAEDAEMAQVFAKLETRAGRLQPALEVIERQEAQSDLRPISRQVLGFCKGKALEKAGEYDAAFLAYEAGNRALPVSFKPKAYLRAVDQHIEAFSADRIATLPRGADSPTPIFIAGMPRSGTTLVEQIIDRHPQAFGAGEITDLEAIAEGLQGSLKSQDPWPACVKTLTEGVAKKLGKQYLDGIRRLSGGASRVVNKSLENYKLAGLINLLLPGSRLIHCRRDVLDNCVSCYLSSLMPPRHAYSFNLRHIAIAYRQYERLMRHWVEVLDLPLLEVSYEQVVAEPEQSAREIIDFCGLEWDDACLEPHKSSRVAESLSYDQVREPIYNSSVGRWRRFEAHLAPLHEELARHA
jgi:tetratricopeptide (TPR) repeat protein